ncbi:hypothetical protein FMEAI12_5100044 [Parafrankia sp. Ea1.12]|nr:hypothetical protein FMEAI12_5100044 [Parafrankia sp. Ea1.12]
MGVLLRSWSHMRWSDRWDSETFLVLGPATFTLPAVPRRRLAALPESSRSAATRRIPAPCHPSTWPRRTGRTLPVPALAFQRRSMPVR